MATNPTIKPRRGTSAPGVGAISQNELAVDTTNKRIYIGAADGSGTLIGSAPAGSSTQVQFNDGGNLGGSSGLLFSKTSFDLTIGGDLAINGGDITCTVTTFNFLSTTVTNANLVGAADTVVIGSANGTTTIRNAGTRINGTLTVTGVSVMQGALSANSTLTVTGASAFQGAILANGGTITSSSTTFNFLNTTVTNANVLGAADTIAIGSSLGSTTIRNANTAINGTLSVTGNATFVGDISVNGGDINSSGALTITAGGSNTNINLVPNGSGTVDVALKRITNLFTPSLDTDAATKKYVDDVAQGLHIHATVKSATTSKLSTLAGVAVTYTSATQAITWSGGTALTSTFTDGISFTVSSTEANADRILIKNEGDVGGLGAAYNGTYYCYGARELRRTLDGNVAADFTGGDFCFVLEGTLYNNTGWVQTEKVITLDTTNILWEQFSGAGTYTADEITLTRSGTQFSIKNTYAGQASINTVGTISTGTWSGSAITIGYGGTGVATYAAGDILYYISGTSLSKLPIGSNTTILESTGSAPSWVASIGSGGVVRSISATLTGATLVNPILTTVTATDLTLNGDIAVNGGDITSTATTFNLLNTTVTNANVFGAANVVQLGGTAGTATIRNAATNINGTLTVTGVSVHQGAGVFNSTLTVTGVTTLQGASTLQGAVNANSTLTVTGVTTLQGASTLQGAVNMNSTLTVTGVSVHQGAGHFNSTLTVTGTSALIGDVTASGDIAINGGDITSTATTFNLLNTTVTNANVLGAANTVVIGGTGGTTTIRNAGTNINGTLTVTGATVIQGALSANSTLTVTGVSTFQSAILANGGTITSSSTTFNLLNTTVTNANVLGAANVIVMGAAATGTAHIRNSNITLGSASATTMRTVTGSTNNLSIIPNGNFIVTPTSSIVGSGTTGSLTIQNGGQGGATSISGAPLLLGDYTDSVGSFQPGELRILESGGSNYTGFKAQAMTADLIYTLPSAFPASNGYVLQSTTAGVLSWSAAASSASVGVTATSASSSYNLVFTDASATSTSATLFIDGGTNIQYNPNTDLLTLAGDIAVNGGDITSTATTFNLLNATVTGLNMGGAAATINIGASGGDVTVAGNFYAVKKSFLIDHPSKKNMKLEYACLEGPENGVYIRGRLEGSKEIILPYYWKDLVHEDSITVQLTSIGSSDSHYVVKFNNKKIKINSDSGNVRCFYLVQAERKDVPKIEVERKIVK